MMAGYFQRDQGKGVVMPVLSATPTFAKERTSDYLSPTSQAMGEGVYRFFELACQKYLVVVNYYSRFIEILSLVEITSRAVIQKLKSIFSRLGIPEELVSDNGTQLKAAMFNEFNAENTT